jgi:hypothetical protein
MPQLFFVNTSIVYSILKVNKIFVLNHLIHLQFTFIEYRVVV